MALQLHFCLIRPETESCSEDMAKTNVKVKRERFSRSPSLSSFSSSRSRSRSPLPKQIVQEKTITKTFKKTLDNNNSFNATASLKQTKQRISRYESVLSQYLAKGPHLKVLTANRNPPALTSQEIGTEDEVWLFQCPQSVAVEKLVGNKLKLNSKPHVIPADASTKFEYLSESPVNNQFYTVISKSADKNKHEAFSFRPAGVVRIQHEIPEVVHSDVFEAVDVSVPYPQNLKVRHPLLGFHFEDRSILSKGVRRLLRKAVTDSNIAKAENLVKREERSSSNTHGRKKKRSANIELDYDAIMGLNEESIKTESMDMVDMEMSISKERTLAADIKDEDERPRKKLKKSKRSKLDDGIPEDLGWISTL